MQALFLGRISDKVQFWQSKAENELPAKKADTAVSPAIQYKNQMGRSNGTGTLHSHTPLLSIFAISKNCSTTRKECRDVPRCEYVIRTQRCLLLFWRGKKIFKSLNIIEYDRKKCPFCLIAIFCILPYRFRAQQQRSQFLTSLLAVNQGGDVVECKTKAWLSFKSPQSIHQNEA